MQTTAPRPAAPLLPLVEHDVSVRVNLTPGQHVDIVLEAERIPGRVASIVVIDGQVLVAVTLAESQRLRDHDVYVTTMLVDLSALQRP